MVTLEEGGESISGRGSLLSQWSVKTIVLL